MRKLETLCSSAQFHKIKVREKSRECHNHKPQPFPDPKRKRKPTNPNKHKPNNRMKSTKISSLFPKRGNRNTIRTEKHKNKMTHKAHMFYFESFCIIHSFWKQMFVRILYLIIEFPLSAYSRRHPYIQRALRIQEYNTFYL